jgi:hypothetical protein
MPAATDRRPLCWGCGTPAPGCRFLADIGWYTRPVVIVTPGIGGFKPVRYAATEVACPACFAEFGWYTPVGQPQEVA